jgi:hypothetical protein
MKLASPAVISNRTPTKVTKPTPDLQEQMRRRAHELYEPRGRNDGHELDDWLQAESEVSQEKVKKVIAQNPRPEGTKPL